MIGFIIKSSIVMAVFIFCYAVFLKGEKRFNFIRIYLVAALVVSLLLPLTDFHLGLDFKIDGQFIDPIHLKDTSEDFVNASNFTQELSPTTKTSKSISAGEVFMVLYCIGLLVMIIRFLRGLMFVYFSARNSRVVSYENQKIYLNDKITTPFSFWKLIILPGHLFQQNKIDDDILIHENAHTSALHSLDIIIAEAILTFYWFNPLVWMINKSIKENHEFAADQQVLSIKNNYKDYSNKLLQYINQHSNLILASTFNFSTIKNRIIMMKTEKSNVRVFSLRVIGSLMILALGFIAVSCYNDFEAANPENDNKFVVALDVAHGGNDNGVVANGIIEKELTLSIAKAIRSLNTSTDLEFILSRTDDTNVSLADRVDFANRNNAQLMISLHVNSSKNENANGIEVYYSNENSHADVSDKFSSLFATKSQFRTDETSRIKEAPFFVLSKSDCPAILVEFGFATNVQDAQFLLDEENIQNLAKSVLTSVISYKEDIAPEGLK